MEKIILPAVMEQLEPMINFVLQYAQSLGFDSKTIGKLHLVAEEALVNVMKYAYPEKKGDITITCSNGNNNNIIIEITDRGIEFNPLNRPDPDTTLPIEERQIGGLGIFMIRKIMDKVEYRRDGNMNVLTLTKNK
jgi:anti-sigma regulatory factor (Ser/Thr protein kinase)